MKSTPKVCAVAAGISALIFLTASPQAATAAPIPGTPLNGTDSTGSFNVFGTIAPVGGQPYSDIAVFEDANRAAPGDIVILVPVPGSTALNEDRSNWAAVARFFSPADPDGSKGTDATDEIGFLPNDTPSGPATDFSTFALFPNVFYANAVAITPDVVDTVITELGPAGAIIAGQTAIIDVTVDGTPEPATAALLAVAAPLLLSRRRRALRCLAQNA